jgi:hypothetical protein
MEYDIELLSRWFESVDGYPGSGRVDGLGYIAVIYHGFKIELWESGEGYLYDIRWKDIYDEVFKEDLAMFIDHGFVLGADLICYKRSLSQMKRHLRIMSKLLDRQKRLKSLDTKGSRRSYNGIQNVLDRMDREYSVFQNKSERLKEKLVINSLI